MAWCFPGCFTNCRDRPRTGLRCHIRPRKIFLPRKVDSDFPAKVRWQKAYSINRRVESPRCPLLCAALSALESGVAGAHKYVTSKFIDSLGHCTPRATRMLMIVMTAKSPINVPSPVALVPLAMRRPFSA